MKFLGKMGLIYVNIKSYKKAGLHPCLEGTFLEQAQGIQIDPLSLPPNFLGLNIMTVLFHIYINGKVCDVIKIVLSYIIPLTLHLYCSLLFLVSYLQNIFVSFSLTF